MSEKKGVKILIIEDEKSLVDLIVKKLDLEGYDVSFAYDGEEGLAKVEEVHPELILLDIQMPKKDGYEVLESLNEAGKKIPVIIISNSGQPVEIAKTKKLGAVDHLIKTEFSPKDVLEKVNKYLEGGLEGDENAKVKLVPRKDDSVMSMDTRVLLVEDDTFLREICSKKLVKEGYTVYEAVDGIEAIDGVDDIVPDIVLLDIILPAVDGFQILHHIKSSKNPKIANVPVIMLSNLGQDDDIKKAMDMGANDYLVKAHFTTEEIAGKVKALVKK